MPDNDIVPRRIRKPWKQAAELVIGGHSIDKVVDECGRALAAELRGAALGPAITELANALDAAVATRQPEVFYAAMERFRRSVSQSPFVPVLLAESEHLLERGLSGHFDEFQEGSVQILVDGSLRRFSEGALFGPEEMLKRVHQATGLSTADLDKYKAEILASLPVSELTKSIVRPGGLLRAPMRRSRATTSEMLDEEVL